MSNLLTLQNKIFNIKNYLFSPTLKYSDEEYLNLYCFLSRVIPWTDENNPPTVTYSDFELKSTYKNMLLIKKIFPSDISAVAERVDWTSGVTYSYYNDKINMYQRDTSGKLVYKFYVRNRYDQVFKCLWNGTSTTNISGVPSTVEPFISAGSDYTKELKTADGYSWKYLYTINQIQKSKFLDKNYIPVPISTYKQDLNNTYTKAGGILSINVFDGGSNFVNGTTTTKVIITGDGYGASANATVSGNKVTSVAISNTGYGYTYANTSVVAKDNYNGSGAIANATISLIGDTAYNLEEELGIDTVLITCEFYDTENGFLQNDIDYRQLGLLLNPNIRSGGYANSNIFVTSTQFNVGTGTSQFIEDEIVYQSATGVLADAYYTANCLSFNSNNNLLYLINTQGTPIIGNVMKGVTSGTSRLCLDITESEIEPYSGKIAYIENRKVIQRTDGGTEQFRLAIKF